MVVENLLQQFIGGSPVLYMLIGLAVLIVGNVIASLVLAHKSKTDNINFEILPDFMSPLLLYGAFLLAGEAMILALKGIPYLYEAAKGFQIFAFGTIVLKYFKQLYGKLKSLGLQTDPALDKKVEELDYKITTGTITSSQIMSNVTTADKIQGTYIPGRPEEDER